jgi:hypothetical protein
VLVAITTGWLPLSQAGGPFIEVQSSHIGFCKSLKVNPVRIAVLFAYNYEKYPKPITLELPEESYLGTASLEYFQKLQFHIQSQW